MPKHLFRTRGRDTERDVTGMLYFATAERGNGEKRRSRKARCGSCHGDPSFGTGVLFRPRHLSSLDLPRHIRKPVSGTIAARAACCLRGEHRTCAFDVRAFCAPALPAIWSAADFGGDGGCYDAILGAVSPQRLFWLAPLHSVFRCMHGRGGDCICHSHLE